MDKTYHLAVCLFPRVTTLDYQGPIELLGCFPSDLRAEPNSHLQFFKDYLPPFAIDVEYISHSEDPITPATGPNVLPTGTYEGVMKSGKQFDIIMIPGGRFPTRLGPALIRNRVCYLTGPLTNPNQVHPSLLQFLKQQAPGVKHILTICTGSWILAGAGLLNGKKATTNKLMYNVVKVCFCWLSACVPKCH